MIDSTPDTLRHIRRVNELLLKIVCELTHRAANHDNSKLDYPEKPFFDLYTEKLKEVEYGSEEYMGYIEQLSVALEHHYQHNRHHPEHFPNGVDDMNLVDVLEMLIDWKAASERHETGDILESIKYNTERFKLAPQLVKILTNTLNLL